MLLFWVLHVKLRTKISPVFLKLLLRSYFVTTPALMDALLLSSGNRAVDLEPKKQSPFPINQSPCIWLVALSFYCFIRWVSPSSSVKMKIFLLPRKAIKSCLPGHRNYKYCTPHTKKFWKSILYVSKSFQYGQFFYYNFKRYLNYFSPKKSVSFLNNTHTLTSHMMWIMHKLTCTYTHTHMHIHICTHICTHIYTCT